MAGPKTWRDILYFEFPAIPHFPICTSVLTQFPVREDWSRDLRWMLFSDHTGQ